MIRVMVGLQIIKNERNVYSSLTVVKLISKLFGVEYQFVAGCTKTRN